MGVAQTSYIESTLTLCNFCLFGLLKTALKGHLLELDNLQEAVVQWLRQQSKNFFADGIYQLVQS
jgi:hypothetical protein